MVETQLVSQSEIERTTGFGRGQLRKWRQRYGFPPAETGVDGRIIYSNITIAKLALIKRLMQAGFPPRKIVSKSSHELELLVLDLIYLPLEVVRSDLIVSLLDLLSKSMVQKFGLILKEDRKNKTLLDFCQNTLGPLTVSVGDAWAKNEIEIYHEHIYTTIVERILISEIINLKPIESCPTFLFALPPREYHQLGLLMAEAVIAEYGARAVNIGADAPLDAIRLAALSIKADVVAVSFSFAYPARDIIPVLQHLRRLLPANMELWAGGRGLASLKKNPRGVVIIRDLSDAVEKAKAMSPSDAHEIDHGR